MTLADFLTLVRRRRWWTASLTVLGVAVGLALALLLPPQYRASASLFVSVGGATVGELSQGGSFSESRVASYSELATSPRVLTAAARSADVDATVDELRRAVSATGTGETVILTVTATWGDPEVAAALAQAVADEVVDVVGGLERPGADGRPLVDLSVYQPAEVPDEPVAPRPLVDVAVGLLVGLAAGIAAALVRESVDTKLRSVEALRRITGASLLAQIPDDPDAARAPLVDVDNRYSQRAEAFRQLRTHLTLTNVDGGPQVVVVTSAIPNEGKSSTSVNLALTLAEAGRRTLLLDADLRRPSLGDLLGIESSVGLSTVLTHQVELEDAVQTVGRHGLHVLAAGAVPPNPSELLGSRQMEMLLATVGAAYDYVVVDAPPVLPVTDPTVLSASATGIVLVASVDGRTGNAEVERAEQTLRAVGARILGVVANRVETKARSATYEAYAPSAPTSQSPRRARRAALAEAASS